MRCPPPVFGLHTLLYMRTITILSLAFLLASQTVFAQCADGTRVGCPPSVNADGVNAIFQRLFGRAASPTEVSLYSGMSTRLSPEAVANAVANSATSAAWISNYHKEQTGRLPDADATKAFQRALAAGDAATVRGMIQNSPGAAEYRQDVAGQMYRRILGRDPSAAEVTAMAEQLKTGDRDAFELGLARSDEGKAKAQAIAQEVLRRPLTDAELTTFTAVLAESGTEVLKRTLGILGQAQAEQAAPPAQSAASGSTASGASASGASGSGGAASTARAGSTCAATQSECIVACSNSSTVAQQVFDCNNRCNEAARACNAGGTATVTVPTGGTAGSGNSSAPAASGSFGLETGGNRAADANPGAAQQQQAADRAPASTTAATTTTDDPTAGPARNLLSSSPQDLLRSR